VSARRRARRVPSPARREAILAAAVDVFAERGFFAAQVADVASRAGVATGTVYLYFKGKDDLLASIFDRTVRDALERGRDLLSSVADPAARLRRFAELHLSRLGENPALAVVLLVEMRQSAKFMNGFSSGRHREYVGLIRDTIALGQARGDFRSDATPALCAKLFLGALDEMAMSWILTGRTYALETDAAALVDLFIHGVQRQPPARVAILKTGRA
jgi:TetR/AcrR family fatty acid metabolism transcriptional regulator